MAHEHILHSLSYGRLATVPADWETVGTISVAGSTLAVSGRSWSSVKAYFPGNTSYTGTPTTYIGYQVPMDWNAIELRFQGTTNNESNVVQMWGSRWDDHFTLLATLTLTTGLQVGDSSALFVDTIVATNEGLSKAGVVCDSAHDRISRYVVDLNGYSKLLFIATTLGSTALQVEVAGY